MKNKKFTFDSENLAFPEIHTGKVKQNDVAEENRRKTINKTTAVHFKSVRLKFLYLILK